MRITATVIFLLASAFAVEGAGRIEAFEALRLLPKERAAKLALIEGRDGKPAPDRWYLVVHDEMEPSGLREFAVAGPEIVASRTISQFAQTIKPEDVIENRALKVDSDDVAKLVQDYARENNASISTLNYELKKEGAEAAPVWKVTCLDETGIKVAELKITASKGTVISHDGFAVEPGPSGKKKPKLSTYAETQVTRPRPRPRAEPETEERRQEPGPSKIDRIGNSLRRLFGG